MSGLEVASGVIGFIETGIALIGRLRKAYQRQTDLSQSLLNHSQELEKIETSIKLVRDEDALQTAAVTSELVEMEKVTKNLIALLKELSKSRGAAHQYVHQLVSGSEEEEKLSTVIDQISRSHEHLALRLQVAHVGLTKTLDSKMAVDMEAVQRIDKLLQEVFGDARKLEMVEFVRSRNPQENGIIALDDADMALLPAADDDAQVLDGTRIVLNNLTEDQAIQINGPVGREGWMEVSYLEIRDNKSVGRSTQVNHAISMDVFKSLLEHRAANMK
ncbi:uncharacterized protein K460DRAFT_306212 [Cucurbitaria berberidis CBS 394.84]|uniref:Uncharacterized protein n=1 Tax=Cucurbitaria berberidis CBS 394.84 TaxID=1168544 RepID=A0A9P4GKR6_9PLEO|nr:uncharacterized protein K460DRAFT_306212 [Cucurbitaria berberidis CBS 394.84]KAF1847244.1 hypothetical protein K460DRAFT_306212 [Cucurbitaria berberidis CBS 394.84]